MGMAHFLNTVLWSWTVLAGALYNSVFSESWFISAVAQFTHLKTEMLEVFHPNGLFLIQEYGREFSLGYHASALSSRLGP